MSARKTFTMLSNIVTSVVFALALCFTAVVVATTLASGRGEASLLGWKPYVVLSDSMRSEFQVGDIAVSHAVDPATLGPGDIVTFESVDPDSYGEVFTHKIREITEYEGERAFVTYGTTTGDDDAYPAPFSRVVGQYAFRIPQAGYVFQFFKSPLGYVVLVLAPFSVLIGLQVKRFAGLLAQRRRESARALAQERARSRALEAELAALRGRHVAPPVAPLPPLPPDGADARRMRGGGFR